MGRFDDVGLFWQDHPVPRGERYRSRVAPEVPETGWRPPGEFPNLSSSRFLSYDVETKDRNLKKRGPGWARGDGHVVGVSVGADDGTAWYFPVRHEFEPETNMDPGAVFGWLATVLGDDRPKIGANLFYDLGWLLEEGVRVRGPHYDVQYAEALLDSESPDVSLDGLASRYLGRGKETSLLYQWLADYFGGPATEKQREWIFMAPPRLVGPYAEADAALPPAILDAQWSRLAAWGLEDLFDVECGLVPLLVAMRRRGVPVDVSYVERLHEELVVDLASADEKLHAALGFPVNVNSPASLAAAFDSVGEPYPRTKEGNPSFRKEFLEACANPLAEMVLERRQIEKIRGTFLESYILDGHVGGRVHCEFHPLKGDGYGTRSGRFASRNPNLQNIPTRTELGKRVRRAFVATAGGRWWKFDYSQIEYRLLAHHAVGEGAENIRRRYRDDPRVDYHEETQELVYKLTGLRIDRSDIKRVNFGFIYGMAERKLARMLNLSSDQARDLFTAYHAGVPFARETMQHYMSLVSSHGYVETFAGRRSQFPKWLPRRWDPDALAMDFEDAVMSYGSVKRAFGHKGLNRALQGGAAEVMKRAMLRAYRDGVFDATGLPLLTVHDELDFDDEGRDRTEAFRELRVIMQTCAPELNVPVVADVEVGSTWGDVKKFELAT